jgi:hypothetical protein
MVIRECVLGGYVTLQLLRLGASAVPSFVFVFVFVFVLFCSVLFAGVMSKTFKLSKLEAWSLGIMMHRSVLPFFKVRPVRGFLINFNFGVVGNGMSPAPLSIVRCCHCSSFHRSVSFLIN